ncbi:hypothetical protein CA951_40715 [Rhodococcus sp. NCIMB 12038]|nr:hypothetical protein CA951_40715 [Rhodococcus sp. NCIMB 12038]
MHDKPGTAPTSQHSAAPSAISSAPKRLAPADVGGPRVRSSGLHTDSGALFVLLLVVTVTSIAVLIFVPMDDRLVGAAVIVLLLLLMALDLPVGIAMLVASIVGLTAMDGLAVVETSLRNITFDGVASWSLSVVPMFLLMGLALSYGGVTTRVFEAADQWLGRLPGGLAVTTTAAGAGLATVSGSTMATSMAIGKMAIPEMMKSGYHPAIATGSVAMAGTLGQIIPPSVLLVIYAGVAQVPVGPQLLAGMIPGLFLALSYIAVVTVWARVKPQVAPRSDRSGVTWGTRLRSASRLGPLVVILLVVLGGLYTGYFTATEAGAVGAVVAILVSLVSPERRQKDGSKNLTYLRTIGTETATSVASIFLIVVGALMLNRALVLSGLAQDLSSRLAGLELDRVTLLLCLIIVYIVLGMFLESLPMILLTVPLLQAPLEAAGVDMIWFGVFLIVLCEIGMVFPPVGLLTFVVHRLAQNPQVNLGVPISLQSVFAGVMPFVAATIVLLGVFIYWPDLVLWLPGSSSAE